MARKLGIILFFLTSITLQGQDIQFNIEYPAVVTVGDQFRITWIVNSRDGEFKTPEFPGFSMLMGPQTSFSQSTQIINGKMSQETSYSYSYYLQALNAGDFTIAPASYTVKNKTYTSDPINIQVLKNGAGQQSIGSANNASGGNTDSRIPDDDVFIKLTINRSDVYIGEHVVATLKIYTKTDLAGLNEIRFPDFNGFLKQEIETPPLTSLQKETINGTDYGTGVIQQFLLYPQIAGEITIDPVQITALIQQRSNSMNQFFGDFFASFETLPRVIVSEPVKLNVKPLPGIKPESYYGAVGKFSITSSIDRDTVKMNEAITLKIILSGNGNIKVAGAPEFTVSPDLELFDPKISENTRSNSSGTTGDKTFEYLLIPRHKGDYSIPEIKYSFYNPSKKQYETLNTDEYQLHILQGDNTDSAVTMFSGVSKEDVKYVGKDVRFIKNQTGKLTRSGNFFVESGSFYSIYGFSLLTFLVFLFVRKEQVKRNSDLSMVRNRKAAKVASQRLKAASTYMKEGETDKFYEEILKAIWGYLSDKLNIPVSELTRNSAIAALTKSKDADSLIDEMTKILDKCEFARYAPATAETEIENTFESATELIKEIESRYTR